ncbi:MAG: serine hydrolase [Lachnospiraceae bacterium]
MAANGWNGVEGGEEPTSGGPSPVDHDLPGISYAYDNDGPTMRPTKEAVEQFRREHEDFSTREYAYLSSRIIPLAFEPGSHFLYGAGYERVLAAVIEVVSGELFGEYLRGHIWEPLGLKSTMFRLRDTRVRENLCGMYGKQERGAGMGEISEWFCAGHGPGQLLASPQSHFEEGGGGVLSTMDDYMRFLRMLAGGGALDGEREF